MSIDKFLTILIVDDNPVNLMLLKAMLTKAGYHVFMAKNGSEARTMVAKCVPDLILLDIMMPGEDGFEAMRRLRENPKTVAIPIIFLSALDDSETKMEGFKLGAVDYITKPFQMPEVLARVKLHLKLSIATNSLIAAQAQKLKQIESAQQSMLVSPDEIPEANFAVWYNSLLEAGGDIYDVFRISKDIFGYFVGDVSGHDIAASFVTASVKALLKQNCQAVYEPCESMMMLNKVLKEISDGKYMTACYARLNRKKKCVILVNAGHPPALYVPVDNKAALIELEGDIIGMFDDVLFDSKEIQVQSGDRFFLFTDGLIERAEEEQVWTNGLQGLLEASDLIRDCPISESAERLKDLIMGDIVPEDDVVVLGFEV
ncbi:MAG: response regulator [Deltaproteobacteria bacterium]|nr:response regulator [Deltaproteobacteria bacterium]